MTRRTFLARTALAAGGATYLLNADGRASAAADGKPDPIGDLSSLANSHDLRLPPWGPYTKTYNGISHIADLERGLRFDLSVFPGHYRREVMVPNVNWEGGFHPWEAAPDLSRFSASCTKVFKPTPSACLRSFDTNGTKSPAGLTRSCSISRSSIPSRWSPAP